MISFQNSKPLYIIAQILQIILSPNFLWYSTFYHKNFAKSKNHKYFYKIKNFVVDNSKIKQHI